MKETGGICVRTTPNRGACGALLLAVCMSAFLIADAAGANAEEGSGVVHVVLCWLKEPRNADAAAEVIRVSRQLRDIPGVLSLVAGPPLPSDRPLVDDSFDVGIVMSFANPETLAAYLNHPEHVRRVTEKLQPLCGQIRIHDIRY